MGQKIHPIGLRLGITRTWDSRWFEKKHYQDWLHEDVKIRKYFTRWMRPAAISRIEIERRTNQVRVLINTGKPGIIIGKRGVGIEEIRKNLETLTGKQVQVNVQEIKHIELDARLVGQNIVDQLEKRIAFRRAMKQAIMRSMKAGARGIKVQISGRLGGAEIARTERNHDGKVPLHTLRADIDYAHVEAFTTFGRIGVKVWIYRGEVLPDQTRSSERTGERPERAQFRDRRDRGARPGRPRPPTSAQPEGSASLPVSDSPEVEQIVPSSAEPPQSAAAAPMAETPPAEAALPETPSMEQPQPEQTPTAPVQPPEQPPVRPVEPESPVQDAAPEPPSVEQAQSEQTPASPVQPAEQPPVRPAEPEPPIQDAAPDAPASSESGGEA